MVRIGTLDLIERPGIVASIGADVIDASRRARSMGADILELRIDLLGIKDEQGLTRVLDEMKEHAGLPVIATNRCREEGGKWNGSEEARIALLISAVPACDAIDVELSAPLRDEVIKAVRSAGKTLIISSHDFTSTPSLDAMRSILRQANSAGADIAKLAVTPNSSADTLRLLMAAHGSDFPVCTIAMGKLGSHTRVVAPIYGSVLTYGSVDRAVAPGQLRIDELKHMLEVLV